MRLSYSETVRFTQTLSVMLDSGIHLQDAVKVCKNSFAVSHKQKVSPLYRFCDELYKKISVGIPLKDAIESVTHSFDSIFCELSAIAERSGNCNEIFRYLAEYSEKRLDSRHKFAQALVYPAIVLFTSIAVAVLIFVLVLPLMKDVLSVFSGDSLELQKTVNSMQKSIRLFSLIAVSALLLPSGLYLAHRFSKKAAFVIDTALLKIPLVSSYIRTSECARFSFAMHILSASGIPFMIALNLAERLCYNKRIKQKLNLATKQIFGGTAACTAFQKQNIFPEPFGSLLSAAHSTGNLKSAFKKISEVSKAECERYRATITSLLEPAMILLSSGAVLIVISQIILPLFKILETL